MADTAVRARARVSSSMPQQMTSVRDPGDDTASGSTLNVINLFGAGAGHEVEVDSTTAAVPGVLLIANQRVKLEQLRVLVPRCGQLVCADGGANRLFDTTAADPGARAAWVPSVIAGDLDSLRSEVREYYEEAGSEMVLLEDQDKHDMDKCVDLIRTRGLVRRPGAVIYVVGALGGRFDHEMANVNGLYTHLDCGATIALVGEETVVTLLPAGVSMIRTSTLEGPQCGLLPIGREVESVTTTGLRWNVTDAKLGFGGLISTSNLIEPGGTVTVNTSAVLVWTCAYSSPNAGVN